MAGVKVFRPNTAGIRKLALRAPGTEQIISDRTEAVFSALQAQVDPRRISHNLAGASRPRGYVVRWGGLAHEAADGALDKALRAQAGR